MAHMRVLTVAFLRKPGNSSLKESQLVKSRGAPLSFVASELYCVFTTRKDSREEFGSSHSYRVRLDHDSEEGNNNNNTQTLFITESSRTHVGTVRVEVLSQSEGADS